MRKAEGFLLMFLLNLPPELSLNVADFQGYHSGHRLYLTLSIRKLSGDTKSYYAHLHQQTVNSLANLKKGEEVFCSTGAFILKHTLCLKDRNLVSDEKCLSRSQLPKYQGIHNMKRVLASCLLVTSVEILILQ